MFRALLGLSVFFLLACGGTVPPPPGDGGQPDQPTDGGTPPPPDAGTPLFSLGGRFVLDTGTLTPAELRVGVLWFPSIDTALPARPRGAETGAQTFANPFPTRWQLDLFSAPPVEAREAYTTRGGGTGFRSVGALVLFRDVNHDGQLTLDAEGDSPDELFGTSAGAMPFDVDGPGLRRLVIWRSGNIGTDETGMKAGFNLVSIDEAFAEPVVLPSTTDVTLTAVIDGRQALTFCEAAYAVDPEEFACGQLVFRTPRVTSIIAQSDGVLFAGIQVNSGKRAIGNASVRLNGVTVQSDGDNGYMMFEIFPNTMHAGLNSVRVDAPGLEPVKMEVMLPTVPSFLTPGQGDLVDAGSELSVSWMGAEVAESFDLTLGNEWGMSDYVTTTQRQATVKVPETPGEATLSLVSSTQRQLGRHLGLGSVELSRTVTVVAP